MDTLNTENFHGKPLDHLGLVADTIAELRLIERIDKKLPSSPLSKLSMGERVAAMIVNGLGFIDTRLYMFPQFLEGTPINRLFGREMNSAWFNDDSLGRCLDDIAEYGVTKLFTELSFNIGQEKKLLGKSSHFDTSTLQLWGEYEALPQAGDQAKDSEIAEELLPAIPQRGYSKSHRHDLKQMVINLATTGRAAFPIWMEAHSGNASDKKVLPRAAKRMNDFCKQLATAPTFLYVGDSALYENIVKESADVKWLTRVPEKLKLAKELISREDDAFQVDSIFLKTPKRITALMMVMTLCLMVYGVSQHDLRSKLKSQGKTVPNSLGKQTDKPTMKWIYYLFRGAHELTITVENVTKQIVINVNELMKEILSYFGERAKSIYLNST